MSFGSNGGINVSGGTHFGVDSVAVFNSNIFVDGAGTSFSALGVGVDVGNNTRFQATNGAVLETSASDFTRSSSGNNTAFLAEGVGSQISFSSMQTIQNTSPLVNSLTLTTSFIARDGGLLDFSMVSSIDGGVVGPASITQNSFQMQNGGLIDLTSLTSISQRNLFSIDLPEYEFPSLLNVGGLILSLSNSGTQLDTPSLVTMSGGGGNSLTITADSVWNAPNLQTLNDTTISLAVGAAINAPNINSFSNSSVTLAPGASFALNDIVNLNNSRLRANSGAAIDLGITEFRRTLRGNNTAFRATGTGSRISALQMEAILNTAAPCCNLTDVTSFIATEGGVLDFSAVTSIDGGGQDVISFTENSFQINSNGLIDLTSVESISGRNRFSIDIPSLDLPSLETGGGMLTTLGVGTQLNTPILTTISGSGGSSFAMPIFSAWNAPNLQSLNDTALSLSVGATLNAPNIANFSNSSVSLEPGINFSLENALNINNSRIQANAGSVIELAVSEFRRTFRGNTTAFRASGAGSRISAPQMQAIINSATPCCNTSETTNFIATDGGELDFPCLTSIDGEELM